MSSRKTAKKSAAKKRGKVKTIKKGAAKKRATKKKRRLFGGPHGAGSIP